MPSLIDVRNVSFTYNEKTPFEREALKDVTVTVKEGETVTIIEDVITSGGAVIDAVSILENMNLKIAAILCVVDREAGADKEFKELGIPYFPLFKRSELD